MSVIIRTVGCWLLLSTINGLPITNVQHGVKATSSQWQHVKRTASSVTAGKTLLRPRPGFKNESSKPTKKADLSDTKGRILIEKEWDSQRWDRDTWNVHAVIELPVLQTPQV